MRRWFLPFVLLLFAALCALAQDPNQQPPAPENTPAPRTDTSSAQSQNPQSADTQKRQDDKDTDSKGNPIKRLGRRVKDQMSSGCVNGLGQHCWGDEAKLPNTNDPTEQPQTAPASQTPPRSDNESSSKERPVSIAPPPGDAMEHAGVDLPDDIRETHPWDPHRSDKNVEVGDYYLKQKNYRAAISRYQEALYWRDNNAIAMYRLGQALEKAGQFADARKQYQNYVKTLPHGEFAAEAHKAIDRLKDKPDQPVTAHR